MHQQKALFPLSLGAKETLRLEFTKKKKAQETKDLYNFDCNEGFVLDIVSDYSLKNRFDAKKILCFVDFKSAMPPIGK
jgi:hypothetical protein